MMLRVTKGASQVLITTVYEKQKLASPYYLWRFISEGLNTEVAFVFAFDSQTERCEKWTFIEGTTAILPSGILQYEIYEQTSSTNTNHLSASTLLERGLCVVHGTASDTYSIPSYNETFSMP